MFSTRNVRSFLGLSLICITCLFTQSKALDLNPGTGQETLMPMSMTSSSLSIDPNDYNFLIYNCYGEGTQVNLKTAMDILGIPYTKRDASNPVTANDLASHDILIVSWNPGGDSSGLIPNTLYNGIDGTVILIGHDLDFHTVHGPGHAKTMFAQAIDYVLASPGTGMIGLTDPKTSFNWLPAEWGVTASPTSGEIIAEFTQAGLDSGVFDGLTPDDLSGWGVSFHNIFTEWGESFEPFEIGGSNGEYTITIATESASNRINLEKYDDVNNCVDPYGDNTITYSICWNNALDPNGIAPTYTDVVIIDYLSEKVSYPAGFEQVIPNLEADPNDPNTYFTIIPPDTGYNENDHTYTWQIGTINPGETNCVNLQVKVKEDVEPGINIYNYAEMLSADLKIGWAELETPVCCGWTGVDPNIIFVNHAANGSNNGTSWQHAYTDLQDALNRASASSCPSPLGGYTIYAAEGTYKPGFTPAETFIVSDDVSMYGGFRVFHDGSVDRNSEKYVTILIGLIDPDTMELNDTLVKTGANTLMDGFTITQSDEYAVLGNGDLFVKDCKIIENNGYGLYAQDGTVNVIWCKIKNSTKDGIYHEGAGYVINIENSVINKNQQHGLETKFSTPNIKNSVVAMNGFASTEQDYYHAINIETPGINPVMHNNTICRNKERAIAFTSNDPNSTVYLDIQNNILWKNNNGYSQISGEDPNFVFYNCIYDANDFDENDYELDANGNFTGNPGFAYNDPNQYDDPSVEFNPHLAFDSPCIDKGSPHLDYIGQSDIDGEQREIVRADIGADEVYSYDGDLSADDIYNRLDRDADGILNYGEFVHFSRAWLTHDPCDPAIYDPNYVPEYDYYNDPNHQLYVDIDGGELDRWDAKCNLADTGPSRYFIDLDDLMIFCRDGYWLWTACWKESQMNRFPRTVHLQTKGGQVMMTAPVPMKSVLAEPAPEATSAEGIAEIIDFVDAAIAENPPNADALYDMKIFLEEIITDLQ